VDSELERTIADGGHANAGEALLSIAKDFRMRNPNEKRLVSVCSK
jgi:hypothetical protein